MRNLSVLIGWPVPRDSRRYRFAIPNMIWDYKLKPIEFMIFSYLCYCCSNQSTEILTSKDIANYVHLTESTIEKYLASLEKKDLVACGALAFSFQCGSREKFFTLPNGIFLLKLPPSAFMVYAYLLLIEDRKTHTCHLSYNTISMGTGISKNTALKSIGILAEAGLIAVEPSCYFDQHGMKWKGNNFYTILPISTAVDIFHQRQLQRLELAAEQARIRKRQERGICAGL